MESTDIMEDIFWDYTGIITSTQPSGMHAKSNIHVAENEMATQEDIKHCVAEVGGSKVIQTNEMYDDQLQSNESRTCNMVSDRDLRETEMSDTESGIYESISDVSTLPDLKSDAIDYRIMTLEDELFNLEMQNKSLEDKNTDLLIAENKYTSRIAFLEDELKQKEEMLYKATLETEALRESLKYLNKEIANKPITVVVNCPHDNKNECHRDETPQCKEEFKTVGHKLEDEENQFVACPNFVEDNTKVFMENSAQILLEDNQEKTNDIFLLRKYYREKK